MPLSFRRHTPVHGVFILLVLCYQYTYHIYNLDIRLSLLRLRKTLSLVECRNDCNGHSFDNLVVDNLIYSLEYIPSFLNFTLFCFCSFIRFLNFFICFRNGLISTFVICFVCRNYGLLLLYISTNITKV